MATVTVPSEVNVGHVSYLLGGKPVRGVTSPDSSTLTADVTDKALRDAISSSDPAWVNPDEPPQADPSDDLAARIQAVHDDPQVSASVKKLTAALLGVGSESAVAGRPTDIGR